jgi:hypothetical protein
MKSKTIIFSSIIVLLIGGLIAAWFSFYELRERTIDGSPIGEANYNQFYLLKKMLHARGKKAESFARLDLSKIKLQSNDTIVMMTDPRSLSQKDIETLLEFIYAGGVLYMNMPVIEGEQYIPIINDVGLSVVEAPFSCLRIKSGRKESRLEPTCGSRRFVSYDYDDEEASHQLNWTWGNEDSGYLMGRVQYGDGELVLSPTLHYFSNYGLREQGMLLFSEQLLRQTFSDGTAYLVYAGNLPPWYMLLWQYFNKAILPFALALLAWLAWRMQRLGSRIPETPPQRRALLEHVNASGEFAFFRKRAQALYAAFQRSLFERLRRRDPLLAALEGDGLIQALSERSGMSQADVRAALMPVEFHRKDQFTTTMRLLAQLRQHL